VRYTEYTSVSFSTIVTRGNGARSGCYRLLPILGNGYNVLPIFKDRLNAKTLITTPNFDVIYALGYLDFPYRLLPVSTSPTIYDWT